MVFLSTCWYVCITMRGIIHFSFLFLFSYFLLHRKGKEGILVEVEEK